MRSDAQVCRDNGWGVGTVLTGYVVWVPHGVPEVITIRITAIGQTAILARRHGCAERKGWRLDSWRDLRALAPPSPEPADAAEGVRNG
jgi:hypothetical protein